MNVPSFPRAEKGDPPTLPLLVKRAPELLMRAAVLNTEITPLLELAPEAKLRLPPGLMPSEVAVPRVRLSMTALWTSIETVELGALIVTL